MKFFVPHSHTVITVASYTEAWIEIGMKYHSQQENQSPPTRRRGLKLIVHRTTDKPLESPPTRRRGLKWYPKTQITRDMRRLLHGGVD